MNYKVGHSTTSCIVKEVAIAVIEELLDEFLPPLNTEMLEIAELGYRTRWDYPFCVGAIDGRQFPIRVNKNNLLYYIPSIYLSRLT